MDTSHDRSPHQQLLTKLNQLKKLLEEATLRGSHKKAKELLKEIKLTENQIQLLK
jgi:hypothetical protein